MRSPESTVAMMCLFIAYFVPAIIAGIREHRSGWAILALDVLLGWTVLGWVAAFIWSLTGNVEQGQKA